MSVRLDIYIKDRLNISRQKSAELIKLSNIKVNDKIITKPSYSIDDGDNIEVLNTDNVLKYVSRGGYKLEKAIEEFNINLNNKVCIDIGASTGGFTDCMLRYGAGRVYACDVGSSQLDKRLREDNRVIVYENTDIRDIVLNEKADFIGCDVSFISVKHILSRVKELLKSNGSAVILIKPQFEAGREYLSKKGIVKNPKIHIRVINDIIKYLNKFELCLNNISYSPVKGGDGNIEYIISVSNNRSNNDFNIDNIVKEAFDKL